MIKCKWCEHQIAEDECCSWFHTYTQYTERYNYVLEVLCGECSAVFRYLYDKTLERAGVERLPDSALASFVNSCRLVCLHMRQAEPKRSTLGGRR